MSVTLHRMSRSATARDLNLHASLELSTFVDDEVDTATHAIADHLVNSLMDQRLRLVVRCPDTDPRESVAFRDSCQASRSWSIGRAQRSRWYKVK